jgi:hypothetical protein
MDDRSAEPIGSRVTRPAHQSFDTRDTSGMDACPAQENKIAMIDIEYQNVVIEAHRKDLHKLYHPVPSEVDGRSNRQRLGAFIVRLGERIGDLRPEIAGESPVATPVLQTRG